MKEKSETMKKLDKIFEKVGPKWLDWHFSVFKNTQTWMDKLLSPRDPWGELVDKRGYPKE